MYIYIHIPFCSSICSYCDFPKVLYDKKYIKNYLDCLKQEIQARYQNEKITSIYIGGGTPTSLDIEELTYLLQITSIFSKNNDIEFTIESNIESLTKEKIQLLKQYGVNRISLGVQSFQEKNLQELNRKHTKQDIFNIINILKQEKFTNISIDYIYGINSNIDDVKKDLNTFLSLDIPHISCYSLIIEKNTIFGINNRPYIEEDTEEAMYKYIKEFLTSKGYSQYEISNYAKEGYQSKHNLNYWDNGEYYGFGMGAVSYINQQRITNTKNLTKYLKQEYIEIIEDESLETQISNTFMLGFRKTSGINIVDFKNKYKLDITNIEPVKKLLKEDRLILENNQLYINPNYLYLSNEIIIEFI